MPLITGKVSDATHKGLTTEAYQSYAAEDALTAIQCRPFALISYNTYDIK